jgi:hypothetical protein
MRRPLILALAGLALVFGVVGAPGVAGADPGPAVSASLDKPVVHPGETVTVTAVFTNPETVPVTFAYLGVDRVGWFSSPDVRYAFTGCSGDVTWCAVSEPDARTAAAHPTAAVAPGDTRTVTFTFQVLPDSACGEDQQLALLAYSYRESSAGATSSSTYGFALTTDVEC